MGNCFGSMTQEEKLSAAIDKQNRMDMSRENQKIKILLLGTGESGKSTIFKQVKKLFGEDFTQEELNGWKTRIYNNINQQLRNIVQATSDLGITLDSEDLREVFESRPNDAPVDDKHGQVIKELWSDKGIQEAWERRAEYQVFDCIEYYVNEIDRIAVGKENYAPTFQDVVHARVRTSGIVTAKFKMNGTPFEMYDVGGQRSERKKWLNGFDNVTTVLFVAAINEYDQKLFEDSRTDRIEEALRVWMDIVNRDAFQDVGFVLFLNKIDLLEEKLQQFPFRVDGVRNEDFEGPDASDPSVNKLEAFEAVKDYMQRKFMSVVELRSGLGQVKIYFTCATDSDNMNTVFNACKDQILRINLFKTGFAAPTHLN
mmetsp:Transcript_9775/g.11137  ORF Transcript_9775/g.11137 Transcript_9775/m.11137 type:complete len:370 (+) Transcript_9775:301-1410(+)